MESRRKCPILLTNVATGKVLSDKMYHGADQELVCEGPTCLGAMMNQDPEASVRLSASTSTTLMEEAEKFMKQIYQEDKVEARMRKVKIEIAMNGTYTLGSYELEEGARLAWRNAARCPGRASWKVLQLFDERSVCTAEEMFKSICRHISYSTNNGNIRPAITVFRDRKPGMVDLRVFNQGLLGYAGYQTEYGIRGDPVNLKFTKFCQSLGWRGPGGRFDILPIVVSGNDGKPRWFDIPEELILRIKLKHKNKDITAMDLEWYGLPAVSSMALHVGGLVFTAAPFVGWYMSTEIAVRNLLDPHRFNLLEEFGLRLGLDTTNNSTLWKDVVAFETNKMVLDSFAQAGVTMVDQHTMSEQFLTHLEEEYKIRGGCPADWVWVVPPMSGSLTGTFHQELINYHLSPSLEYQDLVFMKHIKNENPRISELTSLVMITRFLTLTYSYICERRPKATIIYSTETGTAKRYATSLQKLLGFTYNVHMAKTNEFSVDEFGRQDKHLYAIIASTFGHGDAPLMGREFDRSLARLADKTQKNQIIKEKQLVASSPVHYGVFGLGDSSHPVFCEFSKRVDENLRILQLNRVVELGTGDELSGQEDSFKKWAKHFFVESAKLFGISTKLCSEALLHFDEGEVSLSTKEEGYTWFKFQEGRQRHEVHADMQNMKVSSLTVLNVENLHQEKENRTILVRLKTPADLEYQPGDHLGVMPRNESSAVKYILSRLTSKPVLDMPLQLCIDHKGDWKRLVHFPHGVSLREMLECYMDIAATPSTSLLEAMATYANDEDREYILKLVKSPDLYNQLKQENNPDVSQFLDSVPSVALPATVLVAHLPLIKPRLYSIASAFSSQKQQVDLVVAVVEYEAKDGTLRKGLASNWLAGLVEGDTVTAYVKKSEFKLPEDSSTPIIMIGAGAGISPLRSFWQKKLKEKRRGLLVGTLTLYSGCRSQAMMLLKEETDDLATNLVFRRREAFSREKNIQKKYVQDLVEEDGALLWDLIEEGGYIYVCGRSALAAAVQSQVIKIFREWGGRSDQEAARLMTDMKHEGRYNQDVFGLTFANKKEEMKSSIQENGEKDVSKQEDGNKDVPKTDIVGKGFGAFEIKSPKPETKTSKSVISVPEKKAVTFVGLVKMLGTKNKVKVSEMNVDMSKNIATSSVDDRNDMDDFMEEEIDNFNHISRIESNIVSIQTWEERKDEKL